MDELKTALADRYRVEKELGAGGMATVYLAHDLKHDRKVALKVIKPEVAAALGAQRFLKEIQVTANLQHPHILPLYDSGSADGALFYVMPLVRGESLRDRLTREKLLPIDDAIRIARQVAGALDFAHRQGVIHRDIKPENILLHEGEAMLADFGIALAVQEAGGDRLTGTGLSLGTPQYMSPEQAMAERDIDARSDIYSLGAVTYEMFAGEPPVTGPSPRAMIAKLMTERPTSLCVVRDAVSPSLDAAVMRALAKAPADRYASANDFADALTAAASTPAPNQPVTPVAAVPAPRRSRRMLTIALILVGAIGVFTVARFGLRGAAGGGSTSSVIRSIAVLPLDNYSADSTQEYFAEGMTDELTANLATISKLRVTSRGSAMQFKGKNRPPTPEIGKTLNVDAIVEGSVSRSGDKVRITAQLIDARADKHLWAKSFERKSSDVLALQAELASAIAREINVQLTPSEQSRLAAAPSVNPEAHDAYLRARYFFNRPSDENLRKAIARFDEAVRLSRTFAPAYSGLSDAYLWAGYNEGFITSSQAKPKARATAEKAVQLDSNSAEAHASLANFRAWYGHDWEESEKGFRRALALNPNYAFAHDQYGMMLAFVGRFDEAIAEGRRAMLLDPLSPSIVLDAMPAFMFQRNDAQVRNLSTRASDLDPTLFLVPLVDAWADLDAGRARVAIPKLEKSKAMDAPPFVTAFLSYAYGVSGDRARAMSAFDALKKMSKDVPVRPFNLALVYLGLGERERALDNLEQAYEADSQFLMWLKEDHIFDPLRTEPRFVALMKKMHFTN